MIKQMNIFLSFNGQCKEAIEFYKEVFSAQLIECITYGEAEMTEQENEKDLIMNSNIIIAGVQISCSDNIEQKLTTGNQIAFWLEIDSQEYFDSIYSRFEADNLTILAPKEETFWDSIYAKVQDAFGIIWELNYQK